MGAHVDETGAMETFLEVTPQKFEKNDHVLFRLHPVPCSVLLDADLRVCILMHNTPREQGTKGFVLLECCHPDADHRAFHVPASVLELPECPASRTRFCLGEH